MMNPIKNIEINPLQASSSLGAAMFFLGINNAVVLMHGAVGCASFDKVTLTKHFRENIPIVTTALNEYGAILGGTDFLTSGIKNIYEKMKPDFIGIASSGLTETSGEDIAGIIRDFKEKQDLPFSKIIYAGTPDYKGSLEDGYMQAMLALLEDFSGKETYKTFKKSKKLTKSVNVFCPVSFTPQDFLELREAVGYFDLKPVMIPDLGLSLDGHLDERGYLQTTADGLGIKDMENIHNSEFNIVIGLSLGNAVKSISELTGLATYYFPNVCGLKNSDKLFNLLSELSGKEIPEKYKRQRRQLMDAYLDTHFYFLGKDIALALGIDLLDSFSMIYSEMGANLKIGISTKFSNDIKYRFLNFYEGDLDLLDNYRNVDLIVSNSNAGFYVKDFRIPLLKAGFPLIDEIGHGYKHYILYRGAVNLAVESANLLNKG
ncbi:MAG: nitrogenase iron-molybdenum cofactor biosynthesis protein NifN [Deltaproteobacteria bacterium]|nr:nitrogenase iron-molybdenum cofactor biosynthesis protein NifN [Deltaproteobacteria bacterium]MCL5892613.1 nitrogenase iron-molybdenum cofactor biosynthesis protein NifN [Deltaproteobacteria bacterium]